MRFDNMQRAGIAVLIVLIGFLSDPVFGQAAIQEKALVPGAEKPLVRKILELIHKF